MNISIVSIHKYNTLLIYPFTQYTIYCHSTIYNYSILIRKSSSPWASPILVVDKGDNDFRLVTDYRKINESILGNAWTIPNIENSFASLANQKFYSSLELKEAFYGDELTKGSIPKSAIIPPWGLYEYLRSNFGLKDAMNVYCRI